MKDDTTLQEVGKYVVMRIWDNDIDPAHHNTTCPIFGVRSGIPVIGLGILIIIFALITYLLPGMPPLPAPITLIFAGFGVFLIWLGLTK